MRLLCLSVLIFFCVISIAAAETDYGVGLGFSPGNSLSSRKKEKEIKPEDPFIRKLSRIFENDEKELQKYRFLGFGRNEIIKMLLISRKSGKSLKEIASLRDKNNRFSKICADLKIDHKEIIIETDAIRLKLNHSLNADNTSNSPIENSDIDRSMLNEKVIISTPAINGENYE